MMLIFDASSSGDRVQHLLHKLTFRIQLMLLQPVRGPPLLLVCAHPCPERISFPPGGHGNNFNHKPELTNPFVDFGLFLFFFSVLCACVSEASVRACHTANPRILREGA